MPNAFPTSSAASERSRTRFSWLAFFSATVVLGFLSLELAFYAPRMAAVFDDFHMRLPAATQAFLNLSDLFLRGGWIAFVLMPIGLGFLWPRLTAGPKIRSPEDYARILNRLIAASVTVLAILALLIITYIIMSLPMLSLIEGISNRHGR
jgi:hypothetical protein